MHVLIQLFLGVAVSATIFTSAIAADLDPKAVTFTLPDKIEWKQGSGRAQQAILVGDPSKPGLYVMMVKWLPAGTFVTHFGKQVHYDGAKDEEAVLLITGEGPATSTPAEEK